MLQDAQEKNVIFYAFAQQKKTGRRRETTNESYSICACYKQAVVCHTILKFLAFFDASHVLYFFIFKFYPGFLFTRSINTKEKKVKCVCLEVYANIHPFYIFVRKKSLKDIEQEGWDKDYHHYIVYAQTARTYLMKRGKC